MTENLFAHSLEDADESEWQSLSVHLMNVADMADGFASVFGAGPMARLIGMLHDAGKASEAFQKRLRGNPSPVDHSTAGAKIAVSNYGAVGKSLALLVAGHHGGLPNSDIDGERSSLNSRLQNDLEPYDRYFSLVDLPEKLEPPVLLKASGDSPQWAFSFFMLLKMLYSCLVDADYLDTERFMDSCRAKIRQKPRPTLVELRDRLVASMEELKSSLDEPDSPVNRFRADVLSSCIAAADADSGLFTLTVPTGGGKTLASMSFALLHAIHNGQARIIYALPFTTVTAQVAAVFKKIFGEDAVLEHHSNYSFSEGDDPEAIKERLAVENWDAPIIVTTNVQFFESLYADKPSKCRKVHSIANSVVILDEAQALPDQVLKPCLAALEELTTHYSTSVVLCTATQPALEDIWPFRTKPIEIIPDQKAFSSRLKCRVRFNVVSTIELDDLAVRIGSQRQALCIVNSRKAASTVYDVLKSTCDSESLFHLSAAMVPVHRSQSIARIRERLAGGEECIVISTSLIEAGVDVDFPVVFREVAGIDSILQAAGRCNREGKLNEGEVVVFECDIFLSRRRDWLERMRRIGDGLIRSSMEAGTDPFDDEGVHRFFIRRYETAGEEGLDNCLDGRPILGELCDTQRMISGSYSFEEYGEKFKLIEDEGVSVFVPWGKEGSKLLEELRRSDYPARLASKLQRFTVSVPVYQFKYLENQDGIDKLGPFYILRPDNGCWKFYDEDKGLLPMGEEEMNLLMT